MFNVCPLCGDYSDEKLVVAEESVAVCESCGYRHRFKMMPMFVITGASCAGKTTVGLNLPDLLPECVCLESDILWRDEFNKPEEDFATYRNLWLRMVKNISQSGRSVVLIGSAAPGQFEACAEYRYLTGIKYLALVCDKNELRRRLTARPNWRKSGTEDVVEKMLTFNSWLMEEAEKSDILDVLDTTNVSSLQTTASAAEWVRKCLRKMKLPNAVPNKP